MVVKREKNSSIETLRGIAILLVVMGHVIGYKSNEGLKVADDSFLRHLYFTFEYLRMPLFTVISGWVYALMPAKKNDLIIFTLKKCRRLLLPLIFVGGLYYILQSIVPGTSNSYDLKDIWKILFFPYTLYWYLQSLFIVFIVISIIDSNNFADKFKYWIIFLCVSFLFLIYRDYIFSKEIPNYFGFKGAIYLMPFFLIGIGIKRFESVFKNRYILLIMGILLVSCLILQQLSWYNIIQFTLSKNDGLGLIIGVTGTITLMNLNYKNKYFIWLGNFAYSIYLFHSFGASGSRIIVNAMGLHNLTIMFFISLAFGIFLPIIAEKILDRFKITRLLFLGR